MKPLASALSGMRRRPLAAITLPIPPDERGDAEHLDAHATGFSPARSTSAAALPSGKVIC